MTTKLPHSTVKRMLVGETGLRANGEAVEAFSNKILQFAQVESEKIAKVVESKRRKTIYKEDVLEESEAETTPQAIEDDAEDSETDVTDEESLD